MIAALTGALLQLTAADLGLNPQPSDTMEPRLVRRGQPVTLAVRSGVLTITAQGRALADGRKGDVVRVVTPFSRTTEGIVEGAGTVRVATAN